jgi:hypothetical protein
VDVRQHDLIDMQLRTAAAGQAPQQPSMSSPAFSALDARRRRSYCQVDPTEAVKRPLQATYFFFRTPPSGPHRKRRERADLERRATLVMLTCGPIILTLPHEHN